MATRGLMVFKWKGVYYAIYNHWSSMPAGMGLELVKQIVDWMNRFQGKVEKVKEFLSSLLEGMKYHHDMDFRGHPMNNENAYENLEVKLTDTTHSIAIEWISPRPPDWGWFDSIELSWTIDIEEGKLEMISRSQTLSFTWHQLSFLGAQKWISFEDDELYCFDRDALMQEYTRICIIRCQAVARGFLERLRSLCPPDGLQYLLAKKRFESREQIYCSY
jgi:hypothetical protein